MANVKFTEFPAASTISGSDIIPIVQSGTNKKATGTVFSTYIGTLFVSLTSSQTIAGVKTFSSQLASSVATGTAPFSIASTTKVTNLNADLLDGLSSADFQLALTNPITGTGTTNYLPKFTGTSALGNSILSESGTAISVIGNSGVNDTIFKVQQAADHTAAGIQIIANNAGGAGYNFIESSTNGVGSNWKIWGGAAANNLVIATGGTDRLSITSAGNVGIGTTTPYNRLQVTAFDNTNVIGASASSININNSHASFGMTSDLVFTVATGEDYLKVAAVSSVYTNFGTSVGGDLVFSTNNGSNSLAQKMRIFSNGNVGINTGSTDAGYKLDVNGTARVNSSILATGGLYTNSLTNGGVIQLNYTNSNVGSRSWRIANDVDAYGDFAIMQSTTQSGSTFANRLIFSSTGAATFSSSVGIGAVQSGVSFNINYNSGANDAIRLSNSASGGANWFIGDGTGSGGAAGTFAIAGGATTTPKFSITSGGQVGIGITTPDASAKVQIDSTTQGFLVPRMSEAEINSISSPAEALMVYNTDQKVHCFYDGANWKKYNHSNM